MSDNVFVIGDVHGHLNRLEALLLQEGLLGRCEGCDGAGSLWEPEGVSGGPVDCPVCKGEGWVRQRYDVTIVQLGDLGHFGQDGSPTADILCYKYVTINRWADIVLWGNHDRALVDERHHAFSGYLTNWEAMHYIQILRNEGRMQLAHYEHGFLITHAGLAHAFKQQNIDPELKTDPAKLADWLNDQDERYLDADESDPNSKAIRDAVGRIRGGRVATGGILWRDIEEKLYDGFRQIFGHSADTKKHAVRYCWKDGNTRDPDSPMRGLDDSYCIDIGGKPGRPGADCLAGIWLPSEKIARVDL